MTLICDICCIDRDILMSVFNLDGTDSQRLHGLLVGREDPIDYIKFLRTSGLAPNEAQRKPGAPKLPAMLAREVLSRCEEYDSSRTGKISITIFRCGSHQLQLSLMEY